MKRNAAPAYNAHALKIFDQEPQIAEYEMRALERGTEFDELYFQAMPGAGGLALDVGCGSGRLTLALAERAHSVIGIDLSPAMLTLAQERAATQSNARWILGSANRLPFPAASFEMIVSSSVLRLTDLPRALTEIERVLKPMGRVAIRDVLRGPPSHIPQPIGYVRWTITQSVKLARHFGFSVGWNALRYRFSIASKQYHAREYPWTKTEVEQHYGSILPGCTITWGKTHFFVAWEKSPTHIKAD